MTAMEERTRETLSICPVCKMRIPARYVQRVEGVYLEKNCVLHGAFSTPVWLGEEDFFTWCAKWEDTCPESCKAPAACGLCAAHLTPTCCAILDVTNQCNLQCPYCFAASGAGEDMPHTEVLEAIADMYRHGVRYLHLSGGEPTVRTDLPEIVRFASQMGYAYIQLNTNGLRLAEDPAYAVALEKAGLSCVFLQFDGTTDEIFRRIRGRALLECKIETIRNCDAVRLGIVLVPTIVPGVNDGDIGQIVRFAVQHAPAVKGVHFQPITYLGRYTSGNTAHMTLPELMHALETQSDGMVRYAQFAPSGCDAPLCGFHAEYRLLDGALWQLARKKRDSDVCCCGAPTVERSQRHVRIRWTRSRMQPTQPGSMSAFMEQSNEEAFSISAMAFQDAENLDFARLRRCSIHVYHDGNMIPFCAFHNLYKEKT